MRAMTFSARLVFINNVTFFATEFNNVSFNDKHLQDRLKEVFIIGRELHTCLYLEVYYRYLL